MYCPKCGTQCSESQKYCRKCGEQLNRQTPPETVSSTKAYDSRGFRPKSDARLVSFILGLILGLIGLLLAVIIYHNHRDFEEDPTGTAIVWSIFGMLFWFVIFFVLVAVLFGVSLYAA